MATRATQKIPEYYDEGCLPWPWPEDEVPERIPIEMMQSPTIRRILMILRHRLGPNSGLFMDSNIPVRFNPNNRRVFIAPDICIAPDVDVLAIGLRNSYDLWEVGQPPAFALEVASSSTYRKDLHERPSIYEWIGLGEYWMFDPTGGELYGRPLTGFKLVDGRYEPIEMAPNEHGLESGYSDFLRLRLCSIDPSRHSELAAIQPEITFNFEESIYSAQMLLQNPETGLYLPEAWVAEARRADRAEAENARLRERLRQMEQGQ